MQERTADTQHTPARTPAAPLRHPVEGGWLDEMGEGLYALTRDETTVLVTRKDAELILTL